MKSLSLVILSFFLAQTSFAATKRQKVNTKNLQEKYWNSKGFNTGVVQGRRFFKENRFKLGLENVTLLNDKYSSTDGFDNFRLDAVYFVNERVGIGAFYEGLNLKDNTAMREMSKFNAGGFRLSHVKVDSFYGGSIEFVPIYSKLSWMNKKIIYLDFTISPKLGMATYTQQTNDNSGESLSSLAAGLDFAANVFINNHFSFNIAYRTRAYQAEVVKYDDSSVKEDDSKLNFHNFLSLGFNVYF